MIAPELSKMRKLSERRRADDYGEAGRRPADTHLGTGEQADDHSAHDARDDAAE
jgi:hypothetical protein